MVPRFADLPAFAKGARGVAMMGGRAGSFMPMLLISIRMLRRTQCNLPVEVFVPAQEDYDPCVCVVVLKELNAKCKVLPHLRVSRSASINSRPSPCYLAISRTHRPWMPIISQSSMRPISSRRKRTARRVSSPDPTSALPLSRPSTKYDLLINKPAPTPLSHATTDSSQVFISKDKHFKTLLLAAYYNLHGPSFFYELLSPRPSTSADRGARETFLGASQYFSLPSYRVHEPVVAIGYVDDHGLHHPVATTQSHPFHDYRRQLDDSTSSHLSCSVDPTSAVRVASTVSSAFLHHSGLQLSPAELVGQLELDMRLWDPRSETQARFGRDVEAELWEEIVYVACNWGTAFINWKRPAKTCDELEVFWRRVQTRELQEEAMFAASV